MSADLKFKGPFYQFNTAEDYIQSLIEEPAKQWRYNLLHLIEENAKVLAIYEFIGNDLRTIMAQYFHFNHSLIDEILLVFDSKDLKKNNMSSDILHRNIINMHWV